MKVEKKVDEVAKAKAILDEDNKKKVEVAAKELQVFLDDWTKRHNCQLVIVNQIRNNNQIVNGLQTVINN